MVSTDKKTRQKTVRRCIVLSVGIVLLLLLARGLVGLAESYEKAKQVRDKIQTEAMILEAERARLQRTADYYDTPFAQEEIIREKYRFTKPGESLIVVIPDEGDNDEN